MNLKDIYNEVSRLNGINVYDLIEKLDLHVIENPNFENRKLYSSILFDQKIIFVQPELEEEFKQFLLWHKIGHYLLHHSEGSSFNFYISRFKSKTEMEANSFAFFAMMIGETAENINILDAAIHKGIPEQIAVKVCDLAQSVLQL